MKIVIFHSYLTIYRRVYTIVPQETNRRYNWWGILLTNHSPTEMCQGVFAPDPVSPLPPSTADSVGSLSGAGWGSTQWAIAQNLSSIQSAQDIGTSKLQFSCITFYILHILHILHIPMLPGLVAEISTGVSIFCLKFSKIIQDLVAGPAGYSPIHDNFKGKMMVTPRPTTNNTGVASHRASTDRASDMGQQPSSEPWTPWVGWKIIHIFPLKPSMNRRCLWRVNPWSIPFSDHFRMGKPWISHGFPWLCEWFIVIPKENQAGRVRGFGRRRHGPARSSTDKPERPPGYLCGHRMDRKGSSLWGLM